MKLYAYVMHKSLALNLPENTESIISWRAHTAFSPHVCISDVAKLQLRVCVKKWKYIKDCAKNWQASQL